MIKYSSFTVEKEVTNFLNTQHGWILYGEPETEDAFYMLKRLNEKGTHLYLLKRVWVHMADYSVYWREVLRRIHRCKIDSCKIHNDIARLN